uniref:Reverse transcriptase Ty1/copia-type domain-containing protein n=1 Tax=Tanacetum cinerariifolium TaxID=118510 RepID=A0A699IVP7_TANCI|nr:hypothetical protein [Tanacetum cinerariifolium]
MDVKSAFLYCKIEEEVYVCQPPGFEDPDFPDHVYKVEKALYGLHQAPRAWYETLSSYLLDNRLQRGTIDKTLFIKGTKKEDGIFISQDKYVNEILNKFSFSDVKTASTPMEIHKTLLKDEKGEDVDEHLYRSMIGSLMYLTSSRHDIMFEVYACARFQVNRKISHLHVVKRIFRYLKGQAKLDLWYPKDSPFDLVAYTDIDYAEASLDRKSTIGGCQFLWCRLISWQCKKQTVVANSTTEAEYVAASNCCGQVTLIQNQLLDYGDSNEKKLIQMIKIHTDNNVVDLLTKAFDNGKAVKDKIGTSAHNLNVSAVKTERKQKQKKRKDSVKKKTVNGEEQLQTLVDRKKVFENMKRARKGFSGRETPLFPTMMVQAQEDIESLGEEDASKHGRNIADIDADKEITLVDETAKDQGRFDDQEMFDIGVLDNEEVVVEKIVADREAMLLKKLMLLALQHILAREKNKANNVVIEQWNDVQAKIKADYELAQRQQEEEQEQLTDDEKARLFMQFLEKRMKFFAAKRA